MSPDWLRLLPRADRTRQLLRIEAAKLEEDLWLVPIEDRRAVDSACEGMLPTFTLGNYLMLVEYSGRLACNKKASISAELADISERIGSSADIWQARIKRLSGGRLFGRFLGGSKECLEEAAGGLVLVGLRI